MHDLNDRAPDAKGPAADRTALTVRTEPAGMSRLGYLAALVGAIGFCIIAVLVATGVTTQIDEAALRWFASWRSPDRDALVRDITALGGGVVLTVFTAAGAGFLWLAARRTSAVILIVAMLGGKLFNSLLKVVFDRDRPDVVEWLHHIGSSSFPSGHAMASFIAWGAAAWLMHRLGPGPVLRSVIWLSAAILILAVGTSRVYLGVHYPSDVVAGYFAGLAWLGVVAVGAEAWRSRQPPESASRRGAD